MRISLTLILILIFVSCTRENSLVHIPKLTVSEEDSLSFVETGLSAELNYQMAPIDANYSQYLLFNPFIRSLDTLDFEENGLVLKAGSQLPFEGPKSIPDFTFFSSGGCGKVYLAGNKLFHERGEEVLKLDLSSHLGNMNAYFSIRGGEVKNKMFQFSSFQKCRIYLIIQDFVSNEFLLVEYDFISSTLTKIPFDFANSEMDSHRLVFENGPNRVENLYFPYLSLNDSLLIISYPFFNRISTITLESQIQNDFDFKSNLFKNRKKIPLKSTVLKDLKEYLEVTYDWNSDVRFGPILRLNKTYWFRIVEGEDSKTISLELFSENLKKIAEYDLRAIESNLGSFYFPFKGKIVFGVLNQGNEDFFRFHWVEIE